MLVSELFYGPRKIPRNKSFAGILRAEKLLQIFTAHWFSSCNSRQLFATFFLPLPYQEKHKAGWDSEIPGFINFQFCHASESFQINDSLSIKLRGYYKDQKVYPERPEGKGKEWNANEMNKMRMSLPWGKDLSLRIQLAKCTCFFYNSFILICLLQYDTVPIFAWLLKLLLQVFKLWKL